MHVVVAAVTFLPIVAVAQKTGIQNPLNPSFSSIPRFIAGVLQVMVQIGLPIVALFFLWSGYLFVSASGNEGKLTKAKENFLYVCIGALLILGAWVIATLIGNTVSQVVQGGSPF